MNAPPLFLDELDVDESEGDDETPESLTYRTPGQPTPPLFDNLWGLIFSFLSFRNIICGVMCVNRDWWLKVSDVRNQRKHHVARFSKLGSRYWADESDEE